MATISAYGSKNHKHKFSLIVTETSYSIENNTSQIEFDFRLSEDSGYYFNWYDWENLITYTVTIDGTNYTGSIPEYTPSVSGTSLKRITGIPIPHQTDGTKTINLSFNVKDNTGASYTCGNASKSGTLTLTNIPRGSILGDIDNFNLLDSQGNPTIISLNITKYIDTFYDELNIKIDNTLIKTYSDIKNNDSITFTTQELNQIYNLSKNSNNVPLSFILTTYADSSKETQIGNSSIKTPFGIITNANPIFTDFNYQDINPKTSALSNNVILGYSTLSVSIPTSKKAIAQKSASMVSYSVEDVSLPYSSTQEVYTDQGLPNYNKDTLTVTAFDTRQNSTPVVKNLTLVNYVKLTADETQKSYERQNNVGTQTKITFGGTWWNDDFGLEDNELTVSYKYKIAGSSTWTDGGNITPTISGNNYSFDNYIRGDAPDNGFLVKNSYDLVVRVEDKLDYVEFVYQIIAGSPAIKIKGNKVLEINDIPFEELIPKVEDYVFESGSNSNGNYIKYTNGTMICTRKINLNSVNIQNAWGSLFQYMNTTFYNYAQEFIEPPTLQLTAKATSDAGFWLGDYGNDSMQTKSGFAGICLLRPTKNIVNAVIFITAIGKWK